MSNPIGTAEQRKELRHQHRLVNMYIPSEVKENLGIAFTGLDIAAKAMRALEVRETGIRLLCRTDTDFIHLMKWDARAGEVLSQARVKWSTWIKEGKL